MLLFIKWDLADHFPFYVMEMSKGGVARKSMRYLGFIVKCYLLFIEIQI